MIVKKVVIDKANRLYQLTPRIESSVPVERRRSLVRKTEALDLASFRWPVSDQAVEQSGKNVLKPASQEKLGNLKEELAAWFARHHGAKVDPADQILIGGSISSLIFAIGLAFIDHGDIAFVPDLGIPLYRRVITACGGEEVSYIVSSKDDWLPDFERVHTRLGRVAGILFLNSPHNPTGAELGQKVLADLVWLASRENIVVVNDAAYAAISGRKCASLMAVSGGKRVGVEVYSLAYHFGLPRLPLGFVVGNREIINGISLALELTGRFVPEAYVDLAVQAVRQFPNAALKQVRGTVARNMAHCSQLLESLGLEKSGFETVPYVWAKIHRRRQAATAAAVLYRRHRILVVPGTAFGDSGEGFLRFSLTATEEAFKTANKRLKGRRKRSRPGGEE
jgi:LL-diaminopimelate aminotransferase